MPDNRMESFFPSNPGESHSRARPFGGRYISKSRFLFFPDRAKAVFKTGPGGIESGPEELSIDTSIIFLRCLVLILQAVFDFADHLREVKFGVAYLPGGAFPGLTHRRI